MSTSEQIDRLREAGERLLEFTWDFDVDFRDESLQSRIGEEEGGPWVPSPGRSHRLSARSFQAIREHYYDRFLPLIPVAHKFFESLTEAGGQGLLARRAGMEALDPARRPSADVHYGPVPLPSAKTRSYDRFAESQGGTHVAAARLIWWCAASHRPWEFGYTVDLSWYVWCRAPWIGTLNGRVTLLDGPIEAIRDCVGYLIELVDCQREDYGPSGHPTPASALEMDVSSAAPTDLERPKSSRRRRGTSSPKSWAVGMDAERRWHVFERYRDRWVHRRLIHFARRQSNTLLNLFREGRGVLTINRAYEGLYGEVAGSGPSEHLRAIASQETRHVFKNIKSAISHLRKQFDDSLKSELFEVIEFEAGQDRYRLLVQTGIAIEGVQESGDGINTETGRLEFIPET